MVYFSFFFFFFQAEDGIRDVAVTGVQTCALPICADIETTMAMARARPSTKRVEDAARGIGPPGFYWSDRKPGAKHDTGGVNAVAHRAGPRWRARSCGGGVRPVYLGFRQPVGTSFNGRTPRSGRGYWGSNPYVPASLRSRARASARSALCADVPRS